MDLNYILIWTVCLFCLFLLIKTVPTSLKKNLGWVILVTLILLITLTLTYFVPKFAGIIGGIIWILLILTPLSILKEINQLLYQEKYTKARKLSLYLKYLHPFDGYLELPQILRALEIAHQGNLATATGLIDQYKQSHPFYNFAKIMLFWLKGDWQNCLNFFENQLTLKQINQDSNLLIYYLRCLGETGQIQLLLNHFELVESILEKTGDQNNLNLTRMMVLSFAGEVELVEKILKNYLNFAPKTTQQFWIATAQFYHGNQTQALPVFQNLKEISHPVLINNINWRLSHNFIQGKTGNNQKFIEELNQKINYNLADRKLYQKITNINNKQTYITKLLIIINLILFSLEIIKGGCTNLEVLEKLGALIPQYVIENREYWRLITANFLHYGWLHLSMNMLGLWLVGTFVEKIIGHFFYGLIYLISGMGGMIIFTLLSPIIVDPNIPILLVGASGAIMGLVGVILAIFIKLTYQQKSRMFGERLKLLLLIILFQFIFDVLTPQVSFLIHALGFILGLISGLFIPILI